MSEEMKIKLFEAALELDHRTEQPAYDHHDYYEQSIGAFKMLTVLGLGGEYIRWSIGK